VSFNVVIKRCISHYFSNATDTRVPQNVFLVIIIIIIIILCPPAQSMWA